jgi:hypothetical protein
MGLMGLFLPGSKRFVVQGAALRVKWTPGENVGLLGEYVSVCTNAWPLDLFD